MALRNQPKDKQPKQGGDAAFSAFLTSLEPEQEESTPLSLHRMLHTLTTVLSLSPSATFTLFCVTPLLPL